MNGSEVEGDELGVGEDEVEHFVSTTWCCAIFITPKSIHSLRLTNPAFGLSFSSSLPSISLASFPPPRVFLLEKTGSFFPADPRFLPTFLCFKPSSFEQCYMPSVEAFGASSEFAFTPLATLSNIDDCTVTK